MKNKKIALILATCILGLNNNLNGTVISVKAQERNQDLSLLAEEKNELQKEITDESQNIKELKEIKIDRPLNNTNTTGDIYLKGQVISGETIKEIAVYSNGSFLGNAEIGKYFDGEKVIQSENNKELRYFNFKVRNLKDGKNTLKVVAKNFAGKVVEDYIILNVNSKQKTKIMDEILINESKMSKYLSDINKNLSSEYINNFVEITVKEAKREGVRADLAFALMMHETNFLRFNGDVKPEQNNFGGIGATGGGNPGVSFPSVEIGIRAVVQHLKGYASDEMLINECVDPRFQYVTRKSAIYLEHLGINENPSGYGWAAKENYGYNIKDLMNRFNSINIENKSKIEGYNYFGEKRVGSEIKIEAKSDKNAQFKFLVQDYTTGKWSVLKNYGKENSIKWIPNKEGKYKVAIWVKNEFSADEKDDIIGFNINIDKANTTIDSFTLLGDKLVGDKLNFTVISKNKNTEYQYLIEDYKTNKWEIIQNYSSKNSLEWIPTKPGKYRVLVRAKNKFSIGAYEDSKAINVDISENHKIFNYKYSGSTILGEKIDIFSETGNLSESQYWIENLKTGKWEMIKNYGNNQKNIEWIPQEAGKYRIIIWSRLKGTSHKYQSSISMNLEIKDKNAPIIFDYNIDGKKFLGEDLKINIKSDENLTFKVQIQNYKTNKWEIIQNYSENKSINWKPKEPGMYRVSIWGKRNTGKEINIARNIEITSKSKINSYNYYGNMFEGSDIRIKATSNDQNALYKFLVQDYSTDKWTVLSNYSHISEIKWKPMKAGRYRVAIWVKNKESKNEKDDVVGFNLEIKGSGAIDLGFKFDFGLSGPSPNNPNKLVLHHAAGNSTASSVHDFHRFTNGWAGIGYHFYIHKDGTIYKGREENWRGAHAAEIGPDDGNPNNDTNATSLGIAVQGNYHPETHISVDTVMPKAQEDAVVKLGRHLVQKYGILQIFGHGSPGIGHTSCPGKYYPLEKIKARILDGFVYGIDSDNLDKIVD